MSYFDDLFIDKRVKGKKCETCLFAYEAYDSSKPYPCDVCIHRPTRRKDKSEYIPRDSQTEKESTRKRGANEEVEY